jgi:flavin reductase (DIM6/NTAB) family NADH-FMN oxidoreductase RutF
VLRRSCGRTRGCRRPIWDFDPRRIDRARGIGYGDEEYREDALSGQFASKGGDKFAGLSVGRGHDGVPLLLDCTARFECRTAFQHEGGDHVIFVGEVAGFTHSERPPLIFHGGRYGMLIQKDQAQA